MPNKGFFFSKIAKSSKYAILCLFVVLFLFINHQLMCLCLQMHEIVLHEQGKCVGTTGHLATS